MPTEQEQQMFEQLHGKRPELKRPTHPTTARSPHQSKPSDSAQVNQVRQQSQSAIGLASQGIIGSSGESLQKLDQQLSRFEDRYVTTVQQRIAEVPARIEAKLAAALTWGQEGIDPLDALFAELEAWDVAEVSSIDQFLFGEKALASLPTSQQLSE
ncbi:MAG: hypothetical protein KME15_20120 [Drouetiella hepatica Uher 2000/2452]|jgi:hypothetical protein|uniref:Uncharacterized protein n=1 Tax=Drouetiella hepatica Uher 2000/2452 TaxID=904376 RepID=A0A951QEC6_9CYAN|nr:hypothetical protein [Drouetiella hepatica Uher 2000/2452]